MEWDQVRIADVLFLALDREELEVAYLRGHTYVWSDGRRVHVWARDGADGWEESGWAEGLPSSASGVSVAVDVMDEFVMMRFAELIRERTARAAAERAISAHRGNGGCIVLDAAWDQIADLVSAAELES